MNTAKIDSKLEDLKVKTMEFANEETEAARKFGVKMVREAEVLTKETLEEATSQIVVIAKSLGVTIRKHPIITVAALVAVGFVFAKLLRRPLAV